MDHLADGQLFSTSGPAAWRPLLDLLCSLERLTTDTENPHRNTEALRIRGELLCEVSGITGDLPQTLHSGSPQYRRWITEAVLLWPLFADASGKALLNTIAAAAIVDYPVDFVASETDRHALRVALARVFNWSSAELDAIERHLAKLTENLQVKKAITAAVADRMGRDRVAWPERALALMQSIYGPLPFRVGDIDVVVTTAAIFLCLPYSDTALLVDDWESRPADERAAIRQFLKETNAGQQGLDNVRFPAFGIFDADAVSPSLLDELAAMVQGTAGLEGTTRESVRATLTTMVTLLNTFDVDKYLIHDAAGHGWQETLCEFEWTFRQLPRISAPLETASFVPAFENRKGRTVLQAEALARIVEADLRQRIVIGLNVVMSETLADLIEHKLLRLGQPLPSSSLFPTATLKLDLSLADARRMIHAWRTPYRKLIREAAERERLSLELASAHFPEAGLAEAVDEAARVIDVRFGSAFETSMTVVDDPKGHLRVNLLQRIMSSVVTFDCAVTRFLETADAHRRQRPDLPLWRTPSACIDLLVLLLGWIYEQERTLHIWHLDELLNQQLAATLRQIENEIIQR